MDDWRAPGNDGATAARGICDRNPPMTQSDFDKAAPLVTYEAVRQTLMDMVDIASPTGRELMGLACNRLTPGCQPRISAAAFRAGGPQGKVGF